MLEQHELKRLEAECRRLPASRVRDEESHVMESPILILMSTVLSLNRKWYTQALPARQRFERDVYPSLSPRTLKRFREFVRDASANESDWSRLAQTLWKTNEWGKARMLSELVVYFIGWRESNAPELEELKALQQWALCTPKEQFVGRIKGLGPRAYEQLLWYLEGTQAIKLDRHVVSFVGEVVGRPIPEEETVMALREVASRIGISATALDARIWDYMQSGKGRALTR